MLDFIERINKQIMSEISIIDEYRACKVCMSEVSVVNSKFNLVQCENCKLVFCKYIYSDQTFINVYNQLYNTTQQYEKHIRESETLINKKQPPIGRVKIKILDFLIKREVNNVAEIGAGVGIVAKYFQNRNVNYNGIELDSKTVERAQKAGLNIENGDFTVLMNLVKLQDAVVAFEVVEHLQDLNGLFLILKKQIKSNGYFGFTVPNYNKRLNFKNPGTRIYQSPPPIHLNYFTIESIKNISAFYGFEVVFCKEKRLPYFLSNRKSTYINVIRGVAGRFRGPTIMAVIQRQ